MARPSIMLDQRPLGPTALHRQQPEQGDDGTRFLVTASSIALDGLALAFTQAHVTGVSRFWFGLLFVLVVPGWSIVGLLRLRWPAAEVSLTIAVSFGVTLLIAQAMLWAHAWHPTAEEMGIGLGALPLLGVQLWRDPTFRTSLPRSR